MTFDWKRYNELAGFLAKNPADADLVEACQRSAVSRYYYAAFNHAHAYCQAKLRYKSEQRASDHSGVRRALKGHNGMVALQLEKLCGWRELCDYRDEVDNLPNLVAEAAYASNAVFSLLKR